MNSKRTGKGGLFRFVSRVFIYALLPAAVFLIGFFVIAPFARQVTLKQDLQVSAPEPLDAPTSSRPQRQQYPPVEVTLRRTLPAAPKTEDKAEAQEQDLKIEIHQPVDDSSSKSEKPAVEAQETAGQPQDSDSTVTEDARTGLFRVELPSFSDQSSAVKASEALAAKGYAPVTNKVITEQGTEYRLQVGAFRSKDNADRVADDVRSAGYSAQVHSDN